MLTSYTLTSEHTHTPELWAMVPVVHQSFSDRRKFCGHSQLKQRQNNINQHITHITQTERPKSI